MDRVRHLNIITLSFFFLLLLIITSVSYAQLPNTWTGNGGDSLWTTDANWTAGVPTTLHNVQIDNNSGVGSYVIIRGTNADCNSLTIDFQDTLVIESGDSLNVNRSDLTINGLLITEGSAKISIARDWIRSTSGEFQANQSTITFFDNLDTDIQNTETFYNLTLNKTNRPLTNSGGKLTIINDLLILDGTVVLQDAAGTDMDVGGNITVAADNTTALNLTDDSVDSISVTLGGDLIIGNSTATSFQAGPSTIIFDGSGTQQISTAMTGDGETFGNIVVQKPTGQLVTFSNNVQLTDDLKIESGTVDLNGRQLILGTDSADSLYVEGIFELDAGAVLKMESSTNLVVGSGGELIVVGSSTLNAATITQNSGTYNFEINSGGAIQASYYKIEYMDASGIELKDGAIIDASNNFSNGTIDNITLNGSGLTIGDISGSNQRILISNVNFATNPGGTTYNVSKSFSTDTLEFMDATGPFAGEDYDNDTYNLVEWTNPIPTLTWTGLTKSPDWFDYRNWSPMQVPGATDNVIIPHVTSQYSNPEIITSDASCNDLTIFGGILIVSDGRNLDVNGNLIISETPYPYYGALTLSGSATLNLAGDYSKTDAANFNDNTSTVILDGSENQQITTGGTSTANDALYNLQVNKSSGTVNLVQSLRVVNNFTLTNGTFNAGSSTIIVGGNFVNADTYTAGSGTISLAAGSAGPFTVDPGGASFNNLTINATDATYTHALSTDLDINGNLTITQGVLDANGFDLSVAGNWSNAGSFTHSNATVTFDGLGKQTVDGGGSGSGKSLNNVVCTNSDSVELQGTLAIDGDLNLISGVFNTNGHTLQFGDASDDSIIVSAELLVNDGSEIQLADGSHIVVYSGGVLTIHGNSIATGPLITNQGSGNYSIHILDGATIAADMAVIEYTGDTGIMISSGANVDLSAAFTDIQFQHGNGSAYLTINNGQTFTITGVQFDSAAVSRSSYNVNYTGSGQIQVSDYTGTMSGVADENDNGSGFYGNVRWNFQQTEMVYNGIPQTFGNDLVISALADLGSVSTQMRDLILSIAPFSVARYYTILPESGANANLRLYYGQSELNGENESSLRIWRRRGGEWTELGGTVDVNNNFVELTDGSYLFEANVTDTLILSDATSEESLPVELISFNAETLSDSVVLNWETASELENAFWRLEKKTLSSSEYDDIQSGDLDIEQTGNSYQVIAAINGMGSKASRTVYRYADKNVLPGEFYAYQLSSISFSGEIESYPVVLVEFKPEIEIPLTYNLEDNYPNPFNPVTYIRFGLPFESEVTIEIYNILGQKIVTLANDLYISGTHQVHWDGLNSDGNEVASGVYICHFVATSVETDTQYLRDKKMVLVR